ncbi:reverse transcriptase domain-containing protein [Tanacetum coccineum]
MRRQPSKQQSADFISEIYRTTSSKSKNVAEVENWTSNPIRCCHEGTLVILEECGTMFRFEGTSKESCLKAYVKVHDPQFYWKVNALIITSSDLGFADAYINGDFSLIDKQRGLLDVFLVWMHVLYKVLGQGLAKGSFAIELVKETECKYTGITLSEEQLSYAKAKVKEADLQVRRVYVDEGSSVEVMFEHCFENLLAKVKAGLRETRTDLVGFASEIAKPLGKIDLEVCFGNEGLSRRMSMKFLVIRAPSSYNIILGRPGLKSLHAIPSTIHSMIRFPTPKGIATLVTRATIIAECRLREGKQILTENQPKVHEAGQAD